MGEFHLLHVSEIETNIFVHSYLPLTELGVYSVTVVSMLKFLSRRDESSLAT